MSPSLPSRPVAVAARTMRCGASMLAWLPATFCTAAVSTSDICESPRGLDLKRHEQCVRGRVGAGEGAAEGSEHGRDSGKEDTEGFCASGEQPGRTALCHHLSSQNESKDGPCSGSHCVAVLLRGGADLVSTETQQQRREHA